MLWLETLDNLNAAADLVRRRRYGIIRVTGGKFHSLSFRPWPKLISRFEIVTLGRWKHAQGGDDCRLFYNFPVTSPGFLTLAYIESTSQTSWKSLRRSAEVLDWIAEIRGANASVCELSNEKLSTRLMQRAGWEPHCQHLTGRHFIKRYYGEYPQHAWLPKVSSRSQHFRHGQLPLGESLEQPPGFDQAAAGIGLVDEKVGC
ncbi:hypothetical protein [Blastopirellula marina]|uniref:Uncharacterized protein n=1 Tax=Blastopirellula marina TaxID=124 RepID=A0A2S8GE71_9BACT|nr:hypothetical protein [Blastopirellula marina]PQO42723.1 hypothetical protein C5Y98_00790 [Blastopirellula marina]PTL46489.1 hypothetical protein C5Y97_00790 [Blastopirellula marina]